MTFLMCSVLKPFANPFQSVDVPPLSCDFDRCLLCSARIYFVFIILPVTVSCQYTTIEQRTVSWPGKTLTPTIFGKAVFFFPISDVCEGLDVLDCDNCQEKK